MSMITDATRDIVRHTKTPNTFKQKVPVDYVIERMVAAILIVILLPPMAIIALAIYLQDGGTFLFAHRRIGRAGKCFDCLKFRTMAMDAQERLADLLAKDPVAREEWARDHKLKNDPRVSRLGLFLRKTSLDELPQLFNVIRGDMSLVGPRPIVESEITRYGRRFAHYCRIRPGITGLWQVYGRNDVSYRRRVALDAVYSSRKSLILDVHILVKTVPAVLLRRGSY